MEVSLLFFKYVLILGLTDHVDLAAFFSLVISPNLPEKVRVVRSGTFRTLSWWCVFRPWTLLAILVL